MINRVRLAPISQPSRASSNVSSYGNENDIQIDSRSTNFNEQSILNIKSNLLNNFNNNSNENKNNLECLVSMNYNQEIGKIIDQILEIKKIEYITDAEIQKELFKIIENDSAASVVLRNLKKSVKKEINDSKELISIINNFNTLKSNFIWSFRAVSYDQRSVGVSTISSAVDDSTGSTVIPYYNVSDNFFNNLESLNFKDSISEGRYSRESQNILDIISKLTLVDYDELRSKDLHKIAWLLLTSIDHTLKWGLSPRYLLKNNNQYFQNQQILESTINLATTVLDFKINSRYNDTAYKPSEIKNIDNERFHGLNEDPISKLFYYCSLVCNELKYSLGYLNLQNKKSKQIADSFKSFFYTSKYAEEINSSNSGALYDNLTDRINKIHLLADRNVIPIFFNNIQNTYKFHNDLTENFIESNLNGFYQNYLNLSKTTKNLVEEIDENINIFSLNGIIQDDSLLHPKNLISRIILDFTSRVKKFSFNSQYNGYEILDLLIFNKKKKFNIKNLSSDYYDIDLKFLLYESLKKGPNSLPSESVFLKRRINDNTSNFNDFQMNELKAELKNRILENIRPSNTTVSESSFNRFKQINSQTELLINVSNLERLVENYLTINSFNDSLMSKVIPKIVKDLDTDLNLCLSKIGVSLDSNSNFFQFYNIYYEQIIEIILNCFSLLMSLIPEVNLRRKLQGGDQTFLKLKKIKVGHIKILDDYAVDLKRNNFNSWYDARTKQIVQSKYQNTNYEVKIFESILQNENRPGFAYQRIFNYSNLINIGKSINAETDIIKNYFTAFKVLFDNNHQFLINQIDSYKINFFDKAFISQDVSKNNNFLNKSSEKNVLYNGIKDESLNKINSKIEKLENSEGFNYDLTSVDKNSKYFEYLKNYNKSLLESNQKLKFFVVAVSKDIIKKNYNLLNKLDGNLNIDFKVSKLNNLFPIFDYEDKTLLKTNASLVFNQSKFIKNLTINSSSAFSQYADLLGLERALLSYQDGNLESSFISNSINQTPIILNRNTINNDFISFLKSQNLRMLIQEVFDLELDPNEMDNLIIELDNNEISNLNLLLEPIFRYFSLENLTSLLFKNSNESNKFKLKNKKEILESVIENFKKVDSNNRIYYDLNNDLFKIFDSIYTLLDSYIFKTSSIKDYLFYEENSSISNSYGGVWGLAVDEDSFEIKNLEGTDQKFLLKSNFNLDSYYLSCEFT